MVRYSAYDEECETTIYFLDFRLMRLLPRKKLKPVVERPVVEQAPQSKFVKPMRLSLEICLKKKLNDEAFLRYRMMHNASYKWICI